MPSTGSGNGDPDPALPILYHENSAPRTSFIAIPNIIFFPYQHPCLNFAEFRFPGSSQIPYPVSVYPSRTVYFRQIPADRWITLWRNKSNTSGVPDLIQIHVAGRDRTYIGNLSNDVFEPRTSTESALFALLGRDLGQILEENVSIR